MIAVLKTRVRFIDTDGTPNNLRFLSRGCSTRLFAEIIAFVHLWVHSKTYTRRSCRALWKR